MKLTDVKLKTLYVIESGLLVYTGAEWLEMIYNWADIVGEDYSHLSLFIEEFMETTTKNCHYMAGIC